jgi:hypothetical protein
MLLKVTITDQGGDGRGLAGGVVAHADLVSADQITVNRRTLFSFPCIDHANLAKPVRRGWHGSCSCDLHHTNTIDKKKPAG